MRIDLDGFPFDYGTAVSNPTAKQGGRSFSLNNNSKHVIKRWAIDNVVFKDRQEERCDYLIKVEYAYGVYYWVELKGQDLTKGCRQILSTVSLINVSADARQEARVITTGTNRLDIRTNDYNRLDKLMRKAGGCLRAYTKQGTETI